MSWFTSTPFGKVINAFLFGIPAIVEGLSKGNEKFSDGSSSMGVFNTQNWKNQIGSIFLGNDYDNSSQESLFSQLSGGSSLGSLFGALTNRITAEHLTGAELEQNQFNAAQAQMDRDFQERMANSQYQRGVVDMRAAGVNPALAMSNGGAAAPSGVAAAGSGTGSPFSLDSIISLLLAGKQSKLLDAQARQASDLGKAAMQNAEANTKNASSRAAEVGLKSREVDIQALLANNTLRLGDSTIQLNEARVQEIAQAISESASRIQLQQVDKAAKELNYQFSSETFETNKALVVQQLAYRAIEMSNIQQMTKESAARTALLSDEEAGKHWMSEHPKLAGILDGLGVGTSIVGNLVKGSISGVFGKFSK